MANLYELLSNTADAENETAQDSALYNNLVKATATNELLSLANQNQTGQTGQTGQTTQTTAKTTPSFLGDLSGGFRENAKTPISLNNFTEKTTADGNRKGFAYRLGEGLGSLARMIDSPIGRGLIMGGAVLADKKNGSPLKALAYGTQVAAANQANRLRDKTYRQQLQEQGIDTSNLSNGYLTDTAYKNIIDTANKRKELNMQEKENRRKQTETDYKNIKSQYEILQQAIELPYLDEKKKIEIAQAILNLEKTAKDNYGIDLSNVHKEQENETYPTLRQQEIAKNAQNLEWQPKLNAANISAINNRNAVNWANYALSKAAGDRAERELQYKLQKGGKDEEAINEYIQSLINGTEKDTADNGKKEKIYAF